jgi:thymidine kinase
MRKAIPCHKLSEIEDEWREYEVIGIDEGQFFEDVSCSPIFDLFSFPPNSYYSSLNSLR